MARKKQAAAEPTAEAPSLRLEWRSPAELAENPHNWRTHPEAQVAALGDVIGEVGWAGACLYNERTGRLIDGHARKSVALAQGCEKVPVLVGSWDEAQEAKILATLDPLAALAEADAPKLDALLREVSTGSEALQQMLAGLAEGTGVVPPGGAPKAEPAPPDEFVAYDETIPTEHECPKCGYRWSGGNGPVAEEDGDGGLHGPAD